jgi:hypothetical protein
MGTTYHRSDNTASATTEHHLRMSSLCAKHPNNQHSGEPICEKQDLAAMFEPQEVHEWLPLPLRPSYLEFLSCVSLLLSGVVFYLTIRSSEDHGICDNDNSAVTFFSWRFLPTLVATVYSLLVATLVNDVRRTEIFARLSDPEGATPSVHRVHTHEVVVARFFRCLEQKEEQRKAQLGFAVRFDGQSLGSPRDITFVSDLSVSNRDSVLDPNDLLQSTRSRKHHRYLDRI